MSIDLGGTLADSLGMKLQRRGKSLTGPCIGCNSSDAFSLDAEKGAGHCFSCGAGWSPYDLALAVLGDKERAIALCVALGIFQPRNSDPNADPLEWIASQKSVSVAAFKAFGANVCGTRAIAFPAYGPDGKQCTTFSLHASGEKGLFAKGKPAGLFFPHVDGKPRLPQADETWHLVEGPKDAAALHDLGLLACGLNTCRLAAKFARLFDGVDVVVIPDRDRAGEDGAHHTSRVLKGVAASLSIAILPAEFTETKGADVRDVLATHGGRDKVLQAIADAKTPKEWIPSENNKSPDVSFVEVSMPDGEPVRLEIGPQQGSKPQRLVVAKRGEIEHRDKIDTNSSVSRDRFYKRFAKKADLEADDLPVLLDPHLANLSQEIDLDVKDFGGTGDDDSQATFAVNLCRDWELWHTPSGDAFATFQLNGRKQSWPVRSKMLKEYLSKRHFDETKEAIGSESLSAAINVISAKAKFEGAAHPVHIRFAEHGQNIYIDLCDDDWRAIEITPQGWSIVDDPPVRFRRSSGMLPLPEPQRGGKLDLLRQFMSVDETTWRCIVGFLIGAMRPRGPFPILALFAEHGAGKSSAARIIRSLVDPSIAPIRAEPKDARDLMISANNNWCIAFDNLSHIPSWLSDALCRLSTGGGFATRALFTDQDEVIFDAQRPCMLMAIEEVANRSDLLDRCLIVALLAISDDKRRTETELLAAFESVRPLILGALLDAVSTALRRVAHVKLAKLPRMADFATWVTAAEPGLGWDENSFMDAYMANCAVANQVAIESAQISAPLLKLLKDCGAWSGTCSDLLDELKSRVPIDVLRHKHWPANAQALSGRLKRLATNLRKIGWAAEWHRDGSQRTVSISRCDPSAKNESQTTSSHDASRTSSQGPACEPMQGDAAQCKADAHDACDANDDLFRPSPGPWNPDRF